VNVRDKTKIQFEKDYMDLIKKEFKNEETTK
jgi:hypothetical protein